MNFKEDAGSSIPTLLTFFLYSEKATKFYKISIVYLTVTAWDKSTVEISKKFVAFSEYMNFNQFLYFDHLLQIIVGQKGQAVFGVLQDLRFDACIRYAHANP